MHAFPPKFKGKPEVSPTYSDADINTRRSIDARSRPGGYHDDRQFRLSLDIERPQVNEIYRTSGSRTAISPQSKRGQVQSWAASLVRKGSSVISGSSGSGHQRRGSTQQHQHQHQQPTPLSPGGSYPYENSGSLYGDGEGVTARGSGGGTRGYVSPASHHDGSAVRGEVGSAQQFDDNASYITPTTPHHRPSISTILSGGPHSAETSRRTGPPSVASSMSRSRTTPHTRTIHRQSADMTAAAAATYNNNGSTSNGRGRRFSQADYESPFAGGRLPQPQFNANPYAASRGIYDDSALFPQTLPVRDTSLGGALHTAGGHSHAASFDMPSRAGEEALVRSPGMASMSIADGSGMRPRHTRVGSAVSPVARASILEEARYNTGMAHRDLPAERSTSRPRAVNSWYDAVPSNAQSERDAYSESFAWGAPAPGTAGAASRLRTNSFAAAPRDRHQHQHPSQPAGARHAHRHSQAGSLQITVPGAGSVAGSAQARDRRPGSGSRSIESASVHGSSVVPGSAAAAARKARSSHPKGKYAKTPIRSNWYHRDEMLSESELKDQDFSSSDEDEFGKEGRVLSGDVATQQKLIQKQQREIFDMTMRMKMMTEAMSKTTTQPFEALLDSYQRTCASNRRANREIEGLRGQVAELKDRHADLENQVAHPPPCLLAHGMSEEEKLQFDDMQDELESCRQKLEDEMSIGARLRDNLAEKDAMLRDQQEELARERQRADRLQKTADKYSATINSMVSSGAGQLKATAAAADTSPFRARAGTATTTSETLTLRAPSEMSAADDHMSLSTARFSHTPTAIGARYDAMSKAELVGLVETLETENARLRASNGSIEKEMNKLRVERGDYEDQRNALMGTIRDLQRQEIKASANPIEIDELRQCNQTLEEERDALVEKCSALERQLEDANQQTDEVKRQMAEMMANILRDGDSDADEFVDAEGSEAENDKERGKRRSADLRGISAAQKAQISQLELENKHLRNNNELLEQQVADLKQRVRSESNRFYQLSHEYLRPALREITVDAAQAERADAYVRQWGAQSNMAMAADRPHETPTKQGRTQGVMMRSFDTMDSSQSSMMDHDVLADLNLSRISSYDGFTDADDVDSLKESPKTVPANKADDAPGPNNNKFAWRNSIQSFASGI